MNHKRKKPKQSRSGCMMCKPHKHSNAPKHGMTDREYADKRIADLEAREAIIEAREATLDELTKETERLGLYD